MQDFSHDLPAGRAHPELGRALFSAIETVMGRWEPVVRASLPSADELTFAQLRDDMPKVLEQAARALESEGAFANATLHAITPLHGETRFHQNFRLDELLAEHRILRPIVMEEVSARLGRAMDVEDVCALMGMLDLVTHRAALEFVDHQKRQLQAANEVQSKYLSFLSHDLRGGLNGVCLMIEVLKRELAPEERFKESVDDLDMMRRSIFETIGTMDRFLHAERFRKGKVQVRPSKINLKHLLMDVSAQLAYQAKDKGVALGMDAPAECAITSDKDLLLMVLQNVTANAIKYGSRAPVQLTAQQTADGAWRISVRDHGPGIASDKLADLFRPFSRGETQGQSGVGLGLSIARQAADLLEAKLWAEPNGDGSGTTFHLQLPVEKPLGQV